MITGAQIRAARALLRLDQSELAASAGISLPTIKRAEKADGAPPVRAETMDALRNALQRKGIDFIPAGADRARR
jgi:transcriptional regulator with XRE-family HTH domain